LLGALINLVVITVTHPGVLTIYGITGRYWVAMSCILTTQSSGGVMVTTFWLMPVTAPLPMVELGTVTCNVVFLMIIFGSSYSRNNLLPGNDNFPTSPNKFLEIPCNAKKS
jgi:hypothetical protein